MESSKKLLVFLSHADEDKPTVRILCQRLKDDGFDPWFDEEQILPGHDWHLEIQQAMRKSDAMLLCFSGKSVSKEGYVQREYKKAMEFQEEKPDGTIFVIPVRLDNQEIPFFFREKQYVDFPSGYDKLVTSLKVRAEKLGISTIVSDLLSANVTNTKTKEEKVSFKQVQLVLEGDFKDFNETRKEDLRLVLASLLRVDSNDIRILQAYSGSIIVVFEIPEIAVDRLRELAIEGSDHLGAQGIKSIQVSGEQTIAISTSKQTKAAEYDKIAATYNKLPSDAQVLLRRLPAYHEPMPLNGFILLGPDLPEPRKLLEHLLDVSLLEAVHAQLGNVPQYQCNPLVKDWLNEQGLYDNNLKWLDIAAQYYLFLFLEKRNLSRAIAAYHALRRAQHHTKADLLALKDIIGPLTQAGSYSALLKEWLPPIRQSQDDQARGRAFAHTGFLLKNMGDYETALEYLNQALEIQRKILDKAGEAVTLNYIAMTYQRQGQYETALKYLEQALAFLQRIHDKKGEAVILSNIAQINQAQGDYKTALKNLETALEIQKKTSDQNQSATLNNISQILRAQGDYDTALEHLMDALSIQRRVGDKSGESITLNNISGIYQRRNDYEMALMYLRQALIIQQQIGDKLGEGMTLKNISGIYSRQGEFDTALEYLEKVQTLQEKIGDKAGQVMIFNNIASVYQARGEYETALLHYKRALEIGLELQDQAGEAQTLNNLGTILQSQGNYEAALKNFEQALFLIRKIGGKAGEPAVLNNISAIYREQGNYEMALDFLQMSLAIAKQLGDRIGVAATLTNIGLVYHSHNDNVKALDYLKQALVIRQEIDDKVGQAQSFIHLSQIYRLQGKYEIALTHLEHAREIQQAIGDNAGLSITLLNMGHIYTDAKQVENANKEWRTAYDLAKKMNFTEVLDELASKDKPLSLLKKIIWEVNEFIAPNDFQMLSAS